MLLSRRTFLQQLAAGAAASSFITRRVRAQAPSRQVNHATFGAAGMAWSDLTAIAKHPAVKVVAACDVDLKRAEQFQRTFPEARVYQDYRQLLDKEKDLHSV